MWEKVISIGIKDSDVGFYIAFTKHSRHTFFLCKGKVRGEKFQWILLVVIPLHQKLVKLPKYEITLLFSSYVMSSSLWPLGKSLYLVFISEGQLCWDSTLGWQFLSFNTLNLLLHCLLPWKVCAEKSNSPTGYTCIRVFFFAALRCFCLASFKKKL